MTSYQHTPSRSTASPAPRHGVPTARIGRAALWLAIAIAAAAPAVAPARSLPTASSRRAAVTWLDALDLSGWKQDWGVAQHNRSVGGNPMRIAGRAFPRGVGTHANSRFSLELSGLAARFTADVGVDDEMAGHPGSVEFRVVGDDRPLWTSGVMRVGMPAKHADVGLSGVKTLELVVTDAGDGIDSDHADWANAAILSAVRPTPVVYLETAAVPMVERRGGANLRLDRAPSGEPMQAGGRQFARGFGAVAPCDLIFSPLGGRYQRFQAWVGVDDASPSGAVRFRVLVDGNVRFDATVPGPGRPMRVAVPLAGANELRLVAEQVGRSPAWADWCEPTLSLAVAPAASPAHPTGTYVVHSRAIDLELSASGRLVAVKMAGDGRIRHLVDGASRLAGCRQEGRVVARSLRGGGVQFTRRLVDPLTANACTLTERFTPTPTSIRWDVRVAGTGAPWSTAIETALRWRDAQRTRFWTAWADSRHSHADGWSDPLTPARFDDMRLWYGAPAYSASNPRIGYCPFLYDVFCIPLATVLEDGRDQGLSLVVSPESRLLDLELTTDRRGCITFSHLRHRIGRARAVEFAMDLVPHSADWRAALAWLAHRYPAYVEPPNPAARQMAGCGAYSSYQGELDTPKLRRMAFRLNWQASFEFPYMGMFLPPVAPGEQWVSFRGESTSAERLNAYYRRMRQLGFYVLSYFNVTEFGTRVQYPPPARKATADADLWRDPNGFLYGRLANAILRTAAGAPYGTWEGAVAMDPGDPRYQAFLLEQAKRHIRRTPDMCGICIDRSDWLRLYNPRADDGISWVDDAPARSLFVSWEQMLGRLGPLMHRAGKVVFMNQHVKRLETMRHVDGIFDEFTYHPASINTSGLLGLRKPVIGWTTDESNLKPDPDAFFQRYLHMGIYPMAPFPGNDHSIQPSAWAEGWYMQYGPLLDAMRGRTWVLQPHVVRVAGAQALANVFRVPGGVAVPITFGGRARTAAVTLRNLRALVGPGRPICEAIHPGEVAWKLVSASVHGNTLRLNVPLVRGCAMVRIGQGHAREGAYE